MSDAIATHIDDVVEPAAHRDLRLVQNTASVSDVLDAFAVLRFESSRAIHRLSARMGIAEADYRALFFVGGNLGATPKRLADHLGLTTGAMTSLLDRLEAADAIRRRPNPDDRRSLLLELTAHGREVVDAGSALYAEMFEAAIAPEDRPLVLSAFLNLADQLRAAADAAR